VTPTTSTTPAPLAPAPVAPTAAKIVTGPPQAPLGHNAALPIGLAVGGVAVAGLGIEEVRRRRRGRVA